MVIEEIEISCQESYVLEAVHLGQDTIIILILKEDAGGFVFGEDAEEAGAAAGEGGIERAVGVEGGFYFFELRVQLEHRRLEIVLELIAPGGYRLGDDRRQRDRVFGGCAKSKGPGGADVNAGVYEGEGIGAQVQGYWVKLFAAAAAETGGVEDKERAVAAELCGVVKELFLREVQVELGIEALEGPGAIGGAAAEAGPAGDIFQQVDMYCRESGVIFFEQMPGFQAKVVLRVAGDGDAVGIERRRFRIGQPDAFEGVFERQGIEDRFQIVIAIGATAEDLEAKVELTVREE